MEEPLRYETLTGLRYEQLHELAARIGERAGDVVQAAARPRSAWSGRWQWWSP